MMYLGGGRPMDVRGTRRGFTLIMIFWSLACASHGIAANVLMLGASRLLLGVGEGGGFPAATRAVTEWFPVHERSTAMGIINAGTAVGAVVAPPLIAWVLTSAGWRTGGGFSFSPGGSGSRGRCGGGACISCRRKAGHPRSHLAPRFRSGSCCATDRFGGWSAQNS